MTSLLAVLCLGFDSSEVSERRESVLDDDYQRELPEFTDAEPRTPLDYLREFNKSEENDCNGEATDSSEGACTNDAESAGANAGGSGSGARPGEEARTPGNVADNDSGEASRDGSGADGSETASTNRTGIGDGEDGESPPVPSRKGFWEYEAKPDAPDSEDPPEFELPAGLRLVLQVLGIGLASVIALLIAAWMVRAFMDRTKTAEADEGSDDMSEDNALRKNAPTRPHTRLAEDQLYNEAIHRLLLDIIGRLASRQRGLSSPSLTARELLTRVRLDEASLANLEHLVRAVEEILFARRDADQQTYETCLDHYRDLEKAVDTAGGGIR